MGIKCDYCNEDATTQERGEWFCDECRMLVFDEGENDDAESTIQTKVR